MWMGRLEIVILKIKFIFMLIYIYYFIGLSLLFSFSTDEDIEVYLCKGKKLSTKYHLTLDCKALKKCQGEIYTLKRSLAEKRGRTLCGFEKELKKSEP